MINALVSQCACGSFLTYWLIRKDLKGAEVIRLVLAWSIFICIFLINFPLYPDNYYSQLSLPITAKKQDILIAYRRAAKHHRTDQDIDDLLASENRIQFRRMAETLSDETRRRAYDMYGHTLDEPLDNKMEIKYLVVSSAIYLFCLVLGYMCTFPKPFHAARGFLFVYCMSFLCLDIQTRFSGTLPFSLWIPVLNGLPVFQLVEFTQAIFPAILVLSVIVSNYFFVDESSLAFFLMKNIVITNRAILERMQEIVRTTAYLEQVRTTAADTDMWQLPSTQQKEGKNETDNTQMAEQASQETNAFLNTLSKEQIEKLQNLVDSTKQNQKPGGIAGFISGKEVYSIIFWGVLLYLWFGY
ncbi:DnaJ domain-containing protein [Cardiosporidium cionae]|uniref:DnaJ domain-containing protein n=1 Tax=Cardiosporidium cionae TaxID=476202 RepID=A0ABQ7J767_9APIC|nr:DnaJ domain-containing protein [Cardiosporidium cionae]|eukprot:KAF8819832.1 DnaJ domain-containing protein [Cardiosporidium cionae]